MACENLVKNPSMEVGGSGVATGYYSTGAAVGTETRTLVADALYGTYSQRWQFAAGTNSASYKDFLTQSAGMDQGASIAGHTLTASVFLKGTVSAGLVVKICLRAYDSGGAQLGTSTMTTVTLTTSWTKWSCSYTLPVNTAEVRFFVCRISNIGTGASWDINIDGAYVNDNANGSSGYFDGDNGGSWSGTANDSKSEQVASAISGLSPASGPAGTQVTITGTDFGISGAVTFGGTAATVSSWAPTQIVCNSPTGTGTQSVVVTPSEGGGTASPGSNYSYGTSSITTLSPNHGLPGTLCVITGVGLGSAGTVHFGTASAAVQSWALDGTSVRVTVPSLVPGVYSVTVTPQGSAATAGSNYTVDSVPLRLRRNGVFVDNPTISVRRSGSWVAPASVKVRSGGLWHTVAYVAPTPPTGRDILVTTRTSAAVQSAIDGAQAGDTVVLEGGAYTGSGASPVTLRDYVNLRGAGIYAQGSGGGGGTWLQAPLRWGSYSTISNMLIGVSSSCTHYPTPAGSTASGGETFSNGSHDSRFSFVRFKGSGHIINFTLNFVGNSSGGWIASPRKRYSCYNTVWDDCEFEKPTSAGYSTFAIWWDCRAGGSRVENLRLNRCHFGVKRATGTTADLWGSGYCTPFIQPAPAEHCFDGPRPDPSDVRGAANLVSPTDTPDSTNGWYPYFQWSMCVQGSRDIIFTDCLFEYTTWYAGDICDFSRSYSVWQGNFFALPGTLRYALTAAANIASGWGNTSSPPPVRWREIPDKAWTLNHVMRRCYHKGSDGTSSGVTSFVYEWGKASIVDSCFGCGTAKTGFDGINTGSWNQANRPSTALFTSDWSGTVRSYTPSPFDP